MRSSPARAASHNGWKVVSRGRYVRASSLEEATSSLAEPGSSKVLAGGQSLLP